MTTAPTTTRTDLVTRHLLRGQLLGLESLLGGFIVVVALVGLAIHLLTDVTGSIWGGAIQFLRWFSAAMGVYLTAVYLPVYVAHGRTRREIAKGSAVFSVVLAAWLGVGVLIGFALETGVYRLLGWAHLLPDPHPLGSVTQTATTFAQHGTAFLVWLAVGALGGAAFYRSGVIGMAVVPVGLPLIGLTELLTRQEPIPITVIPDALTEPTAAVALAIGLASAALAMALTWPIVRDIPLRPRAN